MTEKIVPPTWQELDPSSRILNHLSSSRQKQQQQNQKNRNFGDTNMNGQESRVMYLCFLAHYYLELQQGEKAMKVLEGVLHIFPNSHIAASQVSREETECSTVTVSIIPILVSLLSLLLDYK